DPGGIRRARVGEARQRDGREQQQDDEETLHLGPRRLDELAHLLAKLAEALLGLRGPRELLGRQHRADLERGLRAVLRELVAELADAAELRLQVGGLE